MTTEIVRLVEQYASWLRDKTAVRQIDEDWTEITTPYLDRHNDYLQIFAKREGAGFLLTDAGETIQDLEQSGCTLDSEKRQALLHMTVKGFGVKLNDRALEVNASENDFALRKHNLIQSMLAVNDLFYLSVPMIYALFYEDVVAWLDMKAIRYTPRVKFTGKSGFDHLFDFVVPKSREMPERIVRAFNRPNRQAAEAMAFAWLDTREVRAADSRAYAVLNDTDQPLQRSVVEALRSYDITPIAWSEREGRVGELAA